MRFALEGQDNLVQRIQYTPKTSVCPIAFWCLTGRMRGEGQRARLPAQRFERIAVLERRIAQACVCGVRPGGAAVRGTGTGEWIHGIIYWEAAMSLMAHEPPDRKYDRISCADSPLQQ